MSKRHSKPDIPSPDAFRLWLQSALCVVKAKPATISGAIGPSINTVGAFLNNPERGITLAVAGNIEREVRRIAKAKGVELPNITNLLTVARGGPHV